MSGSSPEQVISKRVESVGGLKMGLNSGYFHGCNNGNLETALEMQICSFLYSCSVVQAAKESFTFQV